MPRTPYEEQYIAAGGRPAPQPPVYNSPEWLRAHPPAPPRRPNYQAPGGHQSGVNGGLMGNLPAPAYGNGGYPTPPAAPAAGGGGGDELWNGYRIIQRGPGGNVLVDINGEAKAFDAYGNLLAHLGQGYTSADPNATKAPAGDPAAPVVGGVPGLPTPPDKSPTTFYSPTTGSPYLQLPGNFLAYMGDTQRAQLNDTLKGAGFQATGNYNAYGPSDYLRPAQFDENDLAGLVTSDNVRQWLRFFLGNLGYGQSYQLPAGYQQGSGLPTPPPNPLG